MSITLSKVEREARELPADDRARLVDVLIETLREAPLREIEAAWQREIEERVAAYDRGEIQTHDAADVFAEARRIAR